MNFIELSFLISILAGSIMGGRAGTAWGAVGVLVGTVGGLVVALGCSFGAILLSAGSAKLLCSMDEPPKHWLLFIFWWIGSLAALMVIAVAPFGTIAILTWATEIVSQ